jgi:hypothetical protein
MGVHEGTGRLSKAMKDLLIQWEETKQTWDDPVSRGFEQRHLIPLQMDLKMAAAAMGQMSLLLDNIHRECT